MAIFFKEVACGRLFGYCSVGWLSAQIYSFFIVIIIFFLLKERFTAPSVLHAVGPAGEGGSGDDWQCAQQRERETDFQGAWQSLQAGNSHATE